MGVKAALEKLAGTLDTLVQKHPGLAVLQIDANCAFNSMYREVMLEELEESCPQLLTAFAQWLARRSTAIFITEDGRVIEFHTKEFQWNFIELS